MIMKQFFNRWRKYLKLSPDAESCLLQQAERRKYHADERLIINDKHPPCLYIIQKGMAFGYMEYDEGDRIPWLAKPMESLTQAFDDIGPYYYATYTLQLATDTTIWCLPIAHLKDTIKTYPRVQELLSLLTDLEIERCRRHIDVLQQRTVYHRYVALLEVSPEVALLTPSSFQAAYMGVSQSSYYRAK